VPERQYVHLITEPIPVAAESQPYHGSSPAGVGPLLGIVTEEQIPGCGWRVLMREVPASFRATGPGHVAPHVHDVSQIYMLLSDEPGTVGIEVHLKDEIYTLVSPQSVLVPAGVPHLIRLLHGPGRVLILMAAGDYGAHSFPA
jgi:hypothetical protein